MSDELWALVNDRRRRLRLHVEQHADFIAGLMRPDANPGLVEREVAA